MHKTNAALRELLLTLPNGEREGPGSSRGYIGWDPHCDSMSPSNDGWRRTLSYDSWDSYTEGRFDDPDLNLIVDFYFDIGTEGGAECLILNLWMLHPRKGASRAVEIRNVPPEKLGEVREVLARSWAVHTRHFAWVHSGRE